MSISGNLLTKGGESVSTSTDEKEEKCFQCKKKVVDIYMSVFDEGGLKSVGCCADCLPEILAMVMSRIGE